MSALFEEYKGVRVPDPEAYKGVRVPDRPEGIESSSGGMSTSESNSGGGCCLLLSAWRFLTMSLRCLTTIIVSMCLPGEHTRQMTADK